MKSPVISNNSVVLVSGGGRGITARCVKQLAREYPCTYLLLGRSSLNKQLPAVWKTPQSDADFKHLIMEDMISRGEKPTPRSIEKQFQKIRAQKEIEDTLESFKACGANCEYISVDISDASKLSDVIHDAESRWGKVTGIIHGAGSLADKRIEKKTIEDFEMVVSPKVDGLRNMLDSISVKNLDFLVLFSSIVGVFGNIGQTDYAIANEVLNKTAYQIKRENPECRVHSINWGPWDSGMVTPELAQAFADRNMPVIPASAGADVFVKLLSKDTPVVNDPVQVVVGSIPSKPPVTVSDELHTYYITRKILLEKNPFLVDHKIGENPVLPATCAASWVASACEQLYPGYSFSLIENFKVLKGIIFDSKSPKEYRLELKEILKSSEGRVRFEARISSLNARQKIIFHYCLNVELERIGRPSPSHILSLSTQTGDKKTIPGDSLYADGTLFHGPSFQGVKKILHISEGRMILECNLPTISPEKQGQFPTQTTNPFIYDAIVQSILIWSQRYYEAPCLPSHLERLEHYREIPFNRDCLVDVQIISHSTTHVLADIQVTDSTGNVYVIFHQLQGTISPLLRRFIGKKTSIKN